MSTTDTSRLERALRAFFAADVEALTSAIDADGEVVHLTVCGDTLLELATQPASGDVPREIIDALIQRGARLERALNLAACWNLSPLVTQLLDAGADPTARADAGITPLESAAMHGSTEAADVLVTRGLHRPTLWLAAATGQLEVVRGYIDESGALLKPPGAYRPNFADVGRPAGAPPAEDQEEILGEALVFAAANGRVEVVEHLLGVGVSVDARPYLDTTGLHLAIQLGKVEMVRHLLGRGAATDIPDGVHQSDAAGWAAACDKGDGASAAIRGLVEGRPST